jgi:hypothetical protein
MVAVCIIQEIKQLSGLYDGALRIWRFLVRDQVGSDTPGIALVVWLINQLAGESPNFLIYGIHLGQKSFGSLWLLHNRMHWQHC